MEKKIFLILVCVVLISGCTTEMGESGSEGEYQQVKYPLMVTDDLGRNVTITKEPQRIISTAPSNTEVLFALGLGDRVVGVTEYCNYPPEAMEKEKIGGFSTVSIEKVVALNPDIVFASDKTGEENIEKLENFGIAVVVLHPKDIEDALKNIELVGKITGAEENASKLVADMEERSTVEEKIGGVKPKVLYVVWHDPLMSAGRDTFADDLITRAGGVNIADFEGYKVISLEAVIKENPDVIIASMGHGDARNKTLEYVRGEQRLGITTAVKKDRVYGIDTDLTGRAGPRIVDALEQFSGWIRFKFNESN